MGSIFSTPSAILPDVNVYADYDDEQYLRDAIALLEQKNPLDEKFSAMLRIQIANGYRYLLSYDLVGLA